MMVPSVTMAKDQINPGFRGCENASSAMPCSREHCKRISHGKQAGGFQKKGEKSKS